MEKEKVIEIEIIKINNDYSAFYPVKMDIEALKEFANDKTSCGGEFIPYIDLGINGYKYDILLTTKKMPPKVIKNECIEQLKEEIERLNTSKRWRADYGEMYYYIEFDGKIILEPEYYYNIDNRRYNLGNYFRTKEEAENIAKSKEYQEHQEFWKKIINGEIGAKKK